jgi:hypothetical protein
MKQTQDLHAGTMEETTAKAIIEAAVMPDTADIDSYVDWSMTVHNVGIAGIFGGAIINHDGPGSVVIKWQGKETELSPSPTHAFIISYVDAQPNCTRLVQSGQIKFLVAGTYVIQVHGVHAEDDNWFSDDYREFTVEVSGVTPPPEEKCNLSGTVTGLLGMAVGNASVELGDIKMSTNSAGKYSFESIELGKYTLKVSGAFYYASFEEEINLKEAKDYTEDIHLGLTSMIIYGVPIAAAAGITSLVILRGRATPVVLQQPQLPYYPPPFIPSGYKLVKE